MQRMNKLKIAVLDNGVDEKLLALCGLPDIIQQNKGNISDEEDLFLHGTNCAMIIGLNCADAELYSYKLLDNTGKGNVDDLKSAFDWCEYYGAAEPPVRCGESHLSGLTEPLRSL